LIKGAGIEPNGANERKSLIAPVHAAKEVLFSSVSHFTKSAGCSSTFDKTIMARKKKFSRYTAVSKCAWKTCTISRWRTTNLRGAGGARSEALPLPQLGHGLRLVYLYCSLLATAKLALIDEVENGIHYSSLPTLKVFRI
jgi:hypothetical protein